MTPIEGPAGLRALPSAWVPADSYQAGKMSLLLFPRQGGLGRVEQKCPALTETGRAFLFAYVSRLIGTDKTLASQYHSPATSISFSLNTAYRSMSIIVIAACHYLPDSLDRAAARGCGRAGGTCNGLREYQDLSFPSTSTGEGTVRKPSGQLPLSWTCWGRRDF